MISKKEYKLFPSRYLVPYTKIALILSSYLSTCGRKTEIMVSFCLRSKLSFGKRFYNYQCTNGDERYSFTMWPNFLFIFFQNKFALSYFSNLTKINEILTPPLSLIRNIWCKNECSNATSSKCESHCEAHSIQEPRNGIFLGKPMFCFS